MSNIVGEGFPKEIINQINLRQQKKGAYVRDNQNLTWMNSNTGWVKMVSSVNVTPERFTFVNSPFGGNNSKLNNKLAKEYVLFGGVSNETNTKTTDVTPRSGIAFDKSIFNNNAYGLGGLEYGGLKPMPGITSFNIKTETRGSLKTATIGIKAYNKYQFDIISTLYMSLGYSVLLEWGNAMYWKNNTTFIPDNQYSLTDEFLGDTNGNVAAGYKWDKILSKIEENRIASKGNYDAALGKVVNFTWSIDRDLSYNITVTVRTIGDIVESLKINAINGGVSVNLDNVERAASGSTADLKTQEKIANYAFSSDIGKLLYQTQLALNGTNATQVPNYGAYYITDLKDTNNRIAVKQIFDGDHDDEYYIQFGYFLRLLQRYIIPNVNNNPNQYLININTDIDSNIIALYNRQISSDPSVCNVKEQFNGPSGTTTYAFFQGGNEFRFKPKGATTLNYGRVMNIYFNMVYILDQLESLKDPKENKVVLVDLLKKMCDGFNTATGGFNKLQPVIDENTNEIKFVDEVPLPEKDAILSSISGSSTETAKFLMYGISGTSQAGVNEASIVRDLSFSTTITPALASMITIGAQSNGYIAGQDSTALSTINKGLVDRVKIEVTNPLPSNTPPPNSATPPETLEKKYSEQIKAFYNFINNLGALDSYPKWDEDAISNFKNTNIQFTEYDQYKQTRDAQLTNPKSLVSSPTIGFLPFNLTLTIDGISGMKVYQKYTIDASFLPTSYPDTLEFLIKGITHEIRDNQWITILESIGTPKNPFNSPDVQVEASNRNQSAVQSRSEPTTSAPASTPVSKGPQADLWTLIAISAAENFVNNPQGMADVAQSIYNRLNAGGYGRSIKDIIIAAGQYEPTFKNPGDWRAIKDKDTAIRAYQNAKRVSLAAATAAIETSEKALKDPIYTNSAKLFIGSRTEFLAARPNSPDAVGIVERNPAAQNNAFFWNYNGKTQFYSKRKLSAFPPPSNLFPLV
jgi:hypothetical protein